MASMGGRVGAAGQAHYAASKAAVISLTQVSAVELGPHGIKRQLELSRVRAHRTGEVVGVVGREEQCEVGDVGWFGESTARRLRSNRSTRRAGRSGVACAPRRPRVSKSFRRTRLLALPIAAAMVLVACGGDDDEDGSTDTGATEETAAVTEPASTAPTSTAPASTEPAVTEPTSTQPTDDAAGGGLAGICPAVITIQTDWEPAAEHGWIYEMVGDDATVDNDGLLVRGPLVAGGVDTGVDIEIRAGGPAIGYQTVTTMLYSDDSVLLGTVYTDEGIQNSSEFPTVAVMAGIEKNPQMIMWDPETYPDIDTIADIGEADIPVRYFSGAPYMDYLTQTGILTTGQVDGMYDGTPDLFVADQGVSAQQGTGSVEPYTYEHEVSDWMKPIAYAYINDAGWENYAASIAIRSDRLEENRECLTELVPIIQQSTVDYVNDPAETNALILDAVETFDDGWVYTQAVADYAVETMLGDGLISNGPDDTIGNFDMDRVSALIEKAIPVYEALGQSPKEGLTAEDVVTNDFIDPSIGL